MFKHLRLLTAASLIALSTGLVQAQTTNSGTGACPTSQWVNQVGSNIVSQACAQPTLSDVSGGTFSGQFVIGGATTQNSAVLVNTAVTSSNTANQFGIDAVPTFAPTGASLGTLRGIELVPTLNGSSITVTNFWGISSMPTVAAGFTGTVTGLDDFVARTPSFSSGSTASFSGYFVQPITNGNGITSGTVANTGLNVGAFTAVPASGGTVNNTGVLVAMPSGTNAGTETAIGLSITGNGPTGGTLTRWAVKSTSTADSELTGGLDATPIGAVTPSTGAFTTASATTVNAGASGTAGTVAVFPTTASTGSTTLTASSNSGNTTTNINTAAQAGARTYTVPDAGGNANFMLTGGTQSSTTGLTVTPLRMIDMRTAAGVMMTTSASGTNFGLTVAGGTGASLTGTATASGSTSDVAYIEFVLPPWYIAGTNLTIGISCYYTNSSSSATVHTMTAAGYLENTTTGAQGSNLIGSGAVTCPITTASNQTVTLTGTTLVPGSYVALTLSAAVTNGGGASTEFLTGVTYQ